MTSEKIKELNQEGWEIKYGDIGENLIDYDAFQPGKRFRIGSIEIKITKACSPCLNLGALEYIGKGRIDRFMETLKG